jgi:hypothetical protein
VPQSRAGCSATYYTFGDLKANPRDLLVKYFDASLYFAFGCSWRWRHVRAAHPRVATDAREAAALAPPPSKGRTLETADVDPPSCHGRELNGIRTSPICGNALKVHVREKFH